MLQKVPFLLTLFLLSMPLAAQEKKGHDKSIPRQTIYGQVTDRLTRQPLPGATITLADSVIRQGTTTDAEGNFRLQGLVTGHHILEVRFLGYAPWNSGDLVLRSGQELFLSVEMDPGVIHGEEVTIKAGYDKHQALNRMSVVSARSFSVEETYRFAGSMGDPARMVASFAGVMAENIQRNDIIVRGNSPMSLLWRLDGIEIPNPSHFGTLGTTGGPVTILNNNLLTNSDFLSSAFPAEYGNVLGGVFDLKMRKGNPTRRQWWGQLGWNDFEAGAEGGFKKQGKASYLLACRYSFLELVGKLGLIGYMPRYQDLSLKGDFPATRLGSWSFILMQGTSQIDVLDSGKKPDNWTYSDKGEDIHLKTGLWLAALTHRIRLSDNCSLYSILSIQDAYNRESTDTFSLAAPVPALDYHKNSWEVKTSFSSQLSLRTAYKGLLQTGFITDFFYLQYADSSRHNGTFVTENNIRAPFFLQRIFIEYQQVFSGNLVLTAGIHSMFLGLNQNHSLEPRAALAYTLPGAHILTLGYGLHSQLPPKALYFFRSSRQDGSFVLSNHSLGFLRAHHLVLGYQHSLSPQIRLKTESYYQYLFNIPVRATGFPEYSILNFGDNYSLPLVDSLVNKGSGKNLGLEFTLERFLSKSYYWLVTASLYRSRYRGADRVWRSTAFDGGYILNLLGGYEWESSPRTSFSFDMKSMCAGGKRYVPFDLPATLKTGHAIFDQAHAYAKQYDPFFRIDLRLGFNLNLPRCSQQFALDLQNITNYRNILLRRIDPKTGEIRDDFQFGFFPMIYWKIAL